MGVSLIRLNGATNASLWDRANHLLGRLDKKILFVVGAILAIYLVKVFLNLFKTPVKPVFKDWDHEDELPYLRELDHVFDLGAGAATECLLDQGCQVTSFGSSKEFADRMENLKSQYRDQLHTVEVFFEPKQLPQNQTLSAVVAESVTEYCPRELLVPILKAVFCSLKPGGKFVWQSISLERATDQQKRLMKAKKVWGIPNMDQMKKALKEIGFVIKKYEEMPHDPRFFLTAIKPVANS